MRRPSCCRYNLSSQRGAQIDLTKILACQDDDPGFDFVNGSDFDMAAIIEEVAGQSDTAENDDGVTVSGQFSLPPLPPSLVHAC